MNVTVTNPTAISDPIVEAIEMATDARRTDECCRADAMLQVYGFGTGGSSSSNASTSGGGGVTPASDEPGSPGVDANGQDCECEVIQDQEIVTGGPNGATAIINFEWNTCEGFDQVIPFNYPNTGVELNRQVVREPTCTPITVRDECCKDIEFNVTRYTGNQISGVTLEQLVGNTCEGIPAFAEPLLAYSGTQGTMEWGYCVLGTNDLNIYIGPAATPASILIQPLDEGNPAGQPAVCPPYQIGQEIITNAFGSFYRPYAVVIPEFPAVDCTVEPECNDVPCDEYGNPVTNGDGSALCCPCKEGQVVGTRIIAKNCYGQDIWLSSSNPGILFVQTLTDDLQTFDQSIGGMNAGTGPILNISGPLDGQQTFTFPTVSGGEETFWPAVIWQCDPCVEEPTLLGSVVDIAQQYGLAPKEVDCGDPETLAESYHTIWCEWLKCQQRLQNWMTGVYGLQIVYGLVEATKYTACLNDILGEQKKIAVNQSNNLDLVTECSNAMLGMEGTLKKCENELLKGYVDRLGIANTQADAICLQADDEWSCYRNTYQLVKENFVPGLGTALFDTIQEGTLTSESATEWSSILDQTFLECFLPEMKREFLCILDSANHAATNINDWRDEKRADARALQHHYEQRYKCEEATTIPVIMEMSRCMVEKVCEIRDYLYECGKERTEDWLCAYRDGELEFARDNLDLANSALPKVLASLEWMDRNIPAFNELAKCYREDEYQLSQQIFLEARELAPEIREAYKLFRSQGHDHREFWDNCWKDRQCRLVKNQLDLACELTDCMRDSIERLRCWADESDKRYKWYENAERQFAPKVIFSGKDSVDNLERVSDVYEELQSQFRDIWEQKILPCDLKDLQKTCEAWTRANMIEEVHRNNDDLRDMARLSDDAYRKSLPYAQQLLEDVFQEEMFDFCLEDPAVLHVRGQGDKAIEEFIRCNSRYCGGFMAEGLARLKYQQIMAEGGAVESARRWKWWANEQLQRKRVEQVTSVLGQHATYAQIATNAFVQSTAGNELLMQAVNRTINRVYTYLTQLSDAGNRLVQVNSGMIAAAQNMVNTGHFWPQQALRNESQAQAAKQAVQDDALGILQQGNYFLDRETWATLNGGNYLNSIMSVSQNAVQNGQFWTQQAVSLNNGRHNAATQTVGTGQRTIDQGHDLHRMGSTKVTAALQQSQAAADPALQVAEIGQRYAAKSLDSQADCIQNALDHLVLAGALLDSGISVMSEVRQSRDDANSNAIAAQGNLVNLLSLGSQTTNVNRLLQEQCFRQQCEMIDKAKSFSQENFKIYQDSLHGTTLSGLNSLSDQLSDGLGNSLADLFGGLQNFGVNNSQSAPPFASGGGLPNVGGF